MMYRLLRPFLFMMDPEKAHSLSIRVLKSGMFPSVTQTVDPILKTEVFGLSFPNPIGLAAGCDKNAEVINAVPKLGFGFTEAGSITPKAQPGNSKPRIFRLTQDQAVINRLGFNNKGLDVAAAHFENRISGNIVGANLGANKDSEDRIDDYVIGMRRLAPLADYVTVNISSPNTPGLRALQGKSELEDLLGRLTEVRDELLEEDVLPFPILLKIAPDLADEDKSDISDVACSQEIDGLIISNTTIRRPDYVRDRYVNEVGGLSGAPLKELSHETLCDMYKATNGKIPLVGVGGISSAEDAFNRIKAGASLIQLYSAMIYEGPYVAHTIAKGLAKLLRSEKFENIQDAVGVGAKSQI